MRRLGWALLLAVASVGCSREKPVAVAASEPCEAVREAVACILRVEKTRPAAKGGWTNRLVNVKGLSARDFRRVLTAIPGKDVHVWMPGEREWLLVGTDSTNAVSLAEVMEGFASDTNCTASVAEVFASYVGTREEVLPAFESNLKGEVLPQWFVTKEIPELPWMDVSDIDEDIRRNVLSEIRSMQVVRRLLLEGNMLAARAKDKKGEEAAIDLWAKVALRNPNDPMLLERIENLNRNAKGFLEVGKLLPALKCYETLVLIRPNDAAAVHNFGICLKKIGKLDMAEKVLARARKLAESAAD